MAPVTSPKAPTCRVPAEAVAAAPHPAVEKKPQVAAIETQKPAAAKSVEQVKPVAAPQPVPQSESSKPKPKSPAENKAPQHQPEKPATAQPPSFQSLMDSQIAEQKETAKEASNQPLTWADRVRAAKSAPAQPSAPKTQPVQVASSMAVESSLNGGHRSQHEEPRPKSGQPREPREHRPPRAGFNNNNKEGGERSNGNRSGHSRGGFRGNGRGGRGNGGSFRGWLFVPTP